MAKSKYTVIIMRDDADVKRFKAGPALLRFAGYLVSALVLAAAGGVFGAYRLWRANAVVVEEKKALEQRLAGVNIKLERLQNIERILVSNDPSELKTLLATIAPETQPKNADKNADKAAAKDAAAAATAPPPPAPAEPDKTQTAKGPFEGIPKVDLNVVGVENISMRFDAKGLVLGFGLKNVDPKSTISGNVGLALITASGQLVDVSAKEELGFKIQLFKQMTANIALPPSLSKADVAGLKLTISSSGKTIFSDVYPVSQN
ncbi:MAG: hypothetical protein HQK81_00970 [Desulfovibrionaceae bacterium]|nr:hypothetical protein [Desulfovibrionaceae bacterium]MBF0512619.1 hypothetical protein [Desulfovibrionaceae bacterium]